MVKQHSIHLLFALVLLVSAGMTAQVLTGTITSEGKPLPGVNVTVRGTTFGTITDSIGKFTLNVSPGTHDVVFSLVGYATRAVTVILQEKEERAMTIELKQQEVQIPEVLVTVGARATSRTVTDSPLPIDVFSTQEIIGTGQATFDKMLQYRVPSFNTSQTPVNDATALLDPWEIRNMGVSRTLVLINGKRKNVSALVYTQTSPSRGESAVDFSAIPPDAIKRIEILRDGASAQYGSDAIAGVVNVVLKDNTNGGYATVNSGVTDAGDGARTGVSLNHGAPIFDNKGFINYTIDLSRVNEARRSGLVDAKAEADPNIGFGAPLADVQRFLATDPYAGNRNSSPATTAAKFLINSGVSVSDNSDFYANGMYVAKTVNSYANYRTPYWRTLQDYPYLKNFFSGGDSAAYRGYVPTFDGDLVDYNLTLGFKTISNGWKYDASWTLGFNSEDYTVRDSHNRSDIKSGSMVDSAGTVVPDPNSPNVYRENSPINFKPGGTSFQHQVWNLDITKNVTPELSIGLGTEFRSETYQILPGDKASWDGVGADSYAGNRPENSGSFNRYNFGGYFDAGYDVTKDFLISGTIRDEYYSDFANAFVYKVTSRVKALEDKLTLRGSYSSCFKAPSLHEIYTQRVQYSFVPGKGIQSIGLFNNVSPQARELGIHSLQPEKSKNLTFGIGSRLSDNLNLTADYYHIAISDRIVISNRVPLDTLGSQGDFFANSISTLTEGLDIVCDYKGIDLSPGTLGLTFSGNINLTNERDGAIPTITNPLGTFPVIDEQQEALFFTSRPKQKFVGTGTFLVDRWHFILSGTYFGTTQFSQQDDNTNITADYGLKTVFDPKIVSDLAVGYDLSDNINITANVNNLFNVIPAWHFEALNAKGQTELSDPLEVWRITNLLTFNGRYAITTYDGVHFSQLGRSYNASLTYRF